MGVKFSTNHKILILLLNLVLVLLALLMNLVLLLTYCDLVWPVVPNAPPARVLNAGPEGP